MRAMLVAVLWPALALAAVGKVTLVEGKATRSAKRANGAEPLASGALVEQGDRLRVEQGNVRIELADGSVLLIGEGADVLVDEAAFKKGQRVGVSLKLLAGALWAKVAKSLSGAKFEVATDRAVAGARGTAFRVDVLGSAAELHDACVCVYEGDVDVWTAAKKPVVVARGAREQAELGVVAKEKSLGKGRSLPPKHLLRPGWDVRLHRVTGGHQLACKDDPELHGQVGHGDSFEAFIAKHRQ